MSMRRIGVFGIPIQAPSAVAPVIPSTGGTAQLEGVVIASGQVIGVVQSNVGQLSSIKGQQHR